MHKQLTMEETITEKFGSYWWRNWEDVDSGGCVPATCNAILNCYIDEDGNVYSLTSSVQSGMAGGEVRWECKPVVNERLRALVLEHGKR